MLRTRVITAVMMLAVLLPALFWFPQWAWALLMAGLAAVAAWEWGGFMRYQARGRWVLGGATFVLCAAVLALFPDSLGAGEGGTVGLLLPLYWVTLAMWGALVPVWLRQKWPLGKGAFALLVGVFVIIPAWLAIVQLRMLGPTVLLAVMIAVWIADIAAYFFGKNFGRHKLAPAVSPGKTWEGALGGAATVVLYGLLLRHFLVAGSSSLWIWLLALIAIAVFSVLGDLFESLLKRQAGLKDSSGVLPGHGGVLDRIDSLTSVLPLTALLCIVSGALPQ